MVWAAAPWLLPLLWLATALRFLRLDAQSFWNDEGNSARLAERSLRLIVEGAAADVHPPLYYLLLAGWRQLLGEGEFELRALSAFAGVLLVAGVAALGRVMARRRQWGLPLMAGLFAAVHPALVYYSQETRMYALLGLWAVLSTLLLWRLLPWLGRGVRRETVGWAAAYLLVVAAGLYTHYFFPAVLAGHAAAVVLVGIGDWRLESADGESGILSGAQRSRRIWRMGIGDWARAVARWGGIVLGALLLYLPWLPVFVRQTGGRTAGGEATGPFLRGAARWLALGETGGAESWAAMGALGLLLLVGVLAPGRGREGKSTMPGLRLAALAHALIPALLIVLLGATRPAYFKFLMVSAPFVALLAGRGAAVGWQWARRGRMGAGWALGAGVGLLLGLALWGSGQSLQRLYFDPAYARADYRGIAARIAAEAHPNAGIILNAANQWEVFTYYHRDGAPVYPIPRGQPQAKRIAAELEAITAQHERLYALFWGEGERDPERLVERWLDAHTFKAREEWVGDVRFVTYAVAPEAAGEMAVEAGAQFGDAIILQGYTLQGGGADAVVAAGDILQVTLFWQATEPMAQRYKVFLHLQGDDGPPLAQRDAEPVGNLAPTSSWQPGETVVDNHGLLLPPDLAPGNYTLRVGLYLLEDATARLPVRHSADDAEAQGDSFLLGTVTVR